MVKLAVRQYSKKTHSSRQDSDSDSDSDDEVDRRKKGTKHVERVSVIYFVKLFTICKKLMQFYRATVCSGVGK